MAQSLLSNGILLGFVLNTILLSIRMFICSILAAIFRVREKNHKTLSESGRNITLLDSEQRAQARLSSSPSMSSLDDVSNNRPTPSSSIPKLEDLLSYRTEQVLRNDLENICPFFLVNVAFVIICQQLEQPIWHSIIANSLMGLFTTSRIIYLFAYLRNLLILRNVSWLLGFVLTISLAGYSIFCIIFLEDNFQN